MELELVFLPSPSAGHLRSTVELAKLLVDKDDRLNITFIIMPSMLGGNDTASLFDISSLFTATKDRIRYNVLYLNDRSNSDDTEPSLLSYIDSFKPIVKATVAKLIDSIQPQSQRLVGFVVDMFCVPMIDVANDFNVPSYMFFTSNATFLGFQIHVQHLYDVQNFDVSELKDSNVTDLDVPSLTHPLPVKCIPSPMLSKEWLPIVLSLTRRIKDTKGIYSSPMLSKEWLPIGFFAARF